MGHHCEEIGEYGLTRKKAEVSTGKMMQYKLPLCPALVLESIKTQEVGITGNDTLTKIHSQNGI